MGKKKKGGNKMAKMSDDERMRYLQARADVEEEARRRKQQLIALYMKVSGLLQGLFHVYNSKLIPIK